MIKNIVLYHIKEKKREHVIKSVRKIVKRLSPSNIKVQVSSTGELSSCFNIKDKIKFEHRHDLIYFGTCPESCVMIITLVKHNDEV